jgi:hypothetical protein
LRDDNVYYNNQEKYPFFKEYNRLCYDLFKDDIGYFFVEYNNDIVEDIVEVGNFIYVKGIEGPIVPNFLIKKMLAIKYIHSKYEYDFMIHTNLSSFWNFPLLLSLYDELPKFQCFGGHFFSNSFITGTGIFVSHDLTPLLLQIPVHSQVHNEDYAISQFMISLGVPVYCLDSARFGISFQIVDESVCDPESPFHKSRRLVIDDDTNTSNVLYFRIKHSCVQRDLSVARKVIKHLYGINI